MAFHVNHHEASYEEVSVDFSSDIFGDKANRALKCPHCKSSYLHHFGFTDFIRTENPLTGSVVDCGGIELDNDNTAITCYSREDVVGGAYLKVLNCLSSEYDNPSMTGNSSIAIKFWCENCHKISLLCISQEKGHSFIKWRALEVK
jgi:hypothetical protein